MAAQAAASQGAQGRSRAVTGEYVGTAVDALEYGQPEFLTACREFESRRGD